MPRGNVTVFESYYAANKFASATGAKLLSVPQAATSETDTFKFWLVAFLKAARGHEIAFVPSGAQMSPDLESIIERLFYAHNGVLVPDPVGGFDPKAERFRAAQIVQLPGNYSLNELIDLVGRVRARGVINGGPGVGLFKAGNVLLVGDRPSNRWGEQRPNWPFVSASSVGCSRWLSTKLLEARIPESELYWINAYSYNGKPLGEATWLSSLAPRLIVALGKEAGGWCKMRGIDHVSAYHPQYWKRFHHDKAYHLTKMINRS